MPKKSAVAVLLALGVLLAPLASQAQAGVGVLQAAATSQGEPQDEPQDEGPAGYQPPSPQSMVGMSGGMAAMTQYCGLSTRAEIEQAFVGKGQPQMARELKLAPAEVKRLFWAAYEATMQRASQASAAEKQKHCKDILALASMGKGAPK
jgi:hypothetical protein